MRIAPLAMGLVLPAVLSVLSACETTPPREGRRAVHADITYVQRIMPPPGHVLSVRLEDVSRADAPATELARIETEIGGRAPPYPVTLTLPASTIDPGREYAVRADIRDADGRLRFTTDRRHTVLTRGAGDTASITLRPVR